jgi:hypothetical protein
MRRRGARSPPLPTSTFRTDQPDSYSPGFCPAPRQAKNVSASAPSEPTSQVPAGSSSNTTTSVLSPETTRTDRHRWQGGRWRACRASATTRDLTAAPPVSLLNDPDPTFQQYGAAILETLVASRIPSDPDPEPFVALAEKHANEQVREKAQEGNLHCAEVSQRPSGRGYPQGSHFQTLEILVLRLSKPDVPSGADPTVSDVDQTMDCGMPTTRVRKPPGAGQAKTPSTLMPTLAGVVLGTFLEDFPFAVHPK